MASVRSGSTDEDRPVTIERRNRYDEVIEAATAVMSERGYSATSVQEIADRVGVLKGSLYHYFSSKEELLFKVLGESHEESERIQRDVHDLGLPPAQELAEYLRQQSLWYLAHVERSNIYFTEARHLTGDRLELTLQRGREFRRHIQDLITAAQADGSIASPLAPALLTRYVLGSLNNVRAWPSRSRPSFTREEMADAFVDLTLHALRAV